MYRKRATPSSGGRVETLKRLASLATLLLLVYLMYQVFSGKKVAEVGKKNTAEGPTLSRGMRRPGEDLRVHTILVVNDQHTFDTVAAWYTFQQHMAKYGAREKPSVPFDANGREEELITDGTDLSGSFTRILHSDRPTERDHHLNELIPTVPVREMKMSRIANGEVMKVKHRPHALTEWFQTIDDIEEDYIMLIDPDMLFVGGPIVNTARPGQPLCHKYGYLRTDTKPEVRRILEEIFPEIVGVALPTHMGPSPQVIHKYDLKRLLPVWMEVQHRIREKGQIGVDVMGWITEMYGYLVASVLTGAPTTIDPRYRGFPTGPLAPISDISMRHPSTKYPGRSLRHDKMALLHYTYSQSFCGVSDLEKYRREHNIDTPVTPSFKGFHNEETGERSAYFFNKRSFYRSMPRSFDLPPEGCGSPVQRWMIEEFNRAMAWYYQQVRLKGLDQNDIKLRTNETVVVVAG
eukprot:TRINITY_DN10714_c0_g1_i1.p1 TRINITY_DN10714_c0_g1~~TRINITY_DN10714_c0_g1_i1.p1  ORF type:complete len:462 (-),score=78.69 TRINITY_DN10714_c0_g1_i1:45-1430(-)